MKLIAMWEALDVNSYRFDPYIGLVCRAGARGFTVSHCLGRSRRRPTEESQTHLRVATQVFVGGLRASTFDAKSTCPCDLAVMLNVATVSDKPPGIDARADPGGAPWLLLDRAAAAVWYVLVIEGKGWAAYNTCLILFCPSTGLSRRVTKHDARRDPLAQTSGCTKRSNHRDCDG